MLTFSIFKEAYIIAKKKYAVNVEKNEKQAIAKVFNDRYTYREEWIPNMERLPGTAMFGLNPRAGYAWMCPDCNKIHHPVESSVFSGLQYPECCNSYAGNRLHFNIRVE